MIIICFWAVKTEFYIWEKICFVSQYFIIVFCFFKQNQLEGELFFAKNVKYVKMYV